MYPTISVVDLAPDGTIVVWHVHSSPDADDAFTGAWVLGEKDGQASGRLGDILANTVVLPTERARGHEVLAELDTDVEYVDLDALAAQMEAALKKYRAAAKQAKESNASLTLPAFKAVQRPNVEEIHGTYHGDPIGRVAWSYATAVQLLIEQWNTIESQRKSRKYLHKEFGSGVLPLPVAT